MSEIVEEFLGRYRRERHFYENLASLAEGRCTRLLEQRGVQAQVASRAKDSGRLAKKLAEREERYQKLEDIYADIVDLAGVRIALYLPGQKSEVENVIRRNFHVVDIRRHEGAPPQKQGTYSKVFPGYRADHFRVKIKAVEDGDQQYEDTLFEIQVTSVLMHAWSEVEHDLVYKPLSGQLTDEERAILDQINGLVLAVELALKQLQVEGERRIQARDSKFRNHYELAAFLFEYFETSARPAPLIGEPAVLMDYLRKTEQDTPAALLRYMNSVDGASAAEPIVNQLLDNMVEGEKDKYGLLGATRSEFTAEDSLPQIGGADVLVGEFINSWASLEKAIRGCEKSAGTRAPLQRLIRDLPSDFRTDFERLRAIRNRVVHAAETIVPSSMEKAIKDVKRLSERLEGYDGKSDND